MKPALLVLLLVLPAVAQLPEAPSHRFLDKQNEIMFSLNAALMATDAATTSAIMHRPYGREDNAIARPFLTGGAGKQAFYWSASFGGHVAAMYFCHRSGHHSIERWMSRFQLAYSTQSVVHNARDLAKY